MSDHLGWVGGLEEGRSHFSWVSGNPMFTDSVFVKGDCEARMSGSTERTMHFICYYCTTYMLDCDQFMFQQISWYTD